MSGAGSKALLSFKVNLGRVEIFIENCPPSEFDDATRKAFEALESNFELILRLTEKFGSSPSRNGGSPTAPASMINLSITEAVRKSGAKKGTDLALVVAYYLLKDEGQEAVNTKDLNDAFDKARLSKLSNINQTLNTLVQSGRMSETQEKDGFKGFKITQTGEEEVRLMLESKA
jgi:hypothetical protein